MSYNLPKVIGRFEDELRFGFKERIQSLHEREAAIEPGFLVNSQHRFPQQRQRNPMRWIFETRRV